MFKVEVIYIAADESMVQLICSVSEGGCVSDALDASGIYSTHPELRDLKVGIFGKLVALDRPLREGDRIEIYRALTVNPMEKRRLRAGKK